MLDPRVDHCIQQIKSVYHIILEVLPRAAHGFTDVGVGGKVHHRIHPRQHRPEPGFVGNVALYQFKALRQTAEPGGEIVVQHDIIAGTSQRARRMTADVACSARYQDRH